MTDPKKKLDILKGSFESGIIDKDEYDKWKEKLEPDVKEFDQKIEEANKTDEQEPKKSSDKALIISIAVIILLFISVIAFSIFNKQQPKTLEI